MLEQKPKLKFSFGGIKNILGDGKRKKISSGNYPHLLKNYYH